ncbi:MAG: GTPase, partial [Terriglobia bacterium]
MTEFVRLGIIGLPNVGKSTLFSALTAADAETGDYPFTTKSYNTGVALMPDQRLHDLSRAMKAGQTIPAKINFVDVAGLVKGASRGEGLGNQFLGYVRDVTAIVHVVRLFQADLIAHVEGRIDPV